MNPQFRAIRQSDNFQRITGGIQRPVLVAFRHPRDSFSKPSDPDIRAETAGELGRFCGLRTAPDHAVFFRQEFRIVVFHPVAERMNQLRIFLFQRNRQNRGIDFLHSVGAELHGEAVEAVVVHDASDLHRSTAPAKPGFRSDPVGALLRKAERGFLYRFPVDRQMYGGGKNIFRIRGCYPVEKSVAETIACKRCLCTSFRRTGDCLERRNDDPITPDGVVFPRELFDQEGTALCYFFPVRIGQLRGKDVFSGLRLERKFRFESVRGFHAVPFRHRFSVFRLNAEDSPLPAGDLFHRIAEAGADFLIIGIHADFQFGGAFLIRIDPAGFQRGIIDESSFIQRLSRFHVFECGGQGADDIRLFREFKDDRHGFSGRNGQRGIQ